MNKIVEKEFFSPNVVKLVVEAPRIAKARKAGHFVIIKIGEKGERIPSTIASSDIEKAYYHACCTNCRRLISQIGSS